MDFGVRLIFPIVGASNNLSAGKQNEQFQTLCARLCSSSRINRSTGYDTHAVVLGANIDLLGGTLKTAGGFVKGERDYDTYNKDGSFHSKNSNDVKGWQIGIGYLYPLSKRTDLYAGAAYVHKKDSTDSDSLTGSSSEGSNENIRSFILGLRHKF